MGGSGLVRSTVSDYAVRQWFPNTQQSQFLTASRRLEKLLLPFIFDTSRWRCETCNNNSFDWTNVTFLGGQNVLWPLLHMFSGSSLPPRISARDRSNLIPLLRSAEHSPKLSVVVLQLAMHNKIVIRILHWKWQGCRTRSWNKRHCWKMCRKTLLMRVLCLSATLSTVLLVDRKSVV